jgi:predicted ATPase/DNA-binding winged helix-turn-helix (wHTH) protein
MLTAAAVRAPREGDTRRVEADPLQIGLHWLCSLKAAGAAEPPAGGVHWPGEEARANAARQGAILFGRFSLLTHSRELLADGSPVPLGVRAIDVLFVLVEAGGQLVTKDELLRRAWPTTVEENCLQFQISTLRKALGPDRNFIKTVSGRGYRFVAEFARAAYPAPARVGERASHPTEEDPSGSWTPPTNLPEPTSDLVGREGELRDIAALVAANRLVTLVGAGGVGKTRLGIELARRLLPEFQDGAWVVELGAVSDPNLVTHAIASALGLGAEAEPAQAIATFLGSKRLLLVLENCERVIDAAATFAEALLRANGSMQVVATSREPLRAEGEWVYPVAPLATPPEGVETIEDVLQHGAAKLFIACACAAEPGIRLDGRLAAAATKVCRRLDGIPLAIELAAASAAVLGVEGLVARLDDRLDLLANGRRTAPARHQSLRATFDWSYELLSAQERRVLERLSVCDGDFTLEEATKIAATAEFGALDVLQSVTKLVAKSLVALHADGSVPRYRLPRTVQTYATEKLLANG